VSGEGAKLATGWLELTVSTKGAQKSITSELIPASKSAGDQAGAGIGSALLGGLKKFAGPIAVLAAGFSIKKVISDSTAAFEGLVAQTNALQRIAGGTKEQVSGLVGAMQLSGVSSEKTSGALTIFSKNLGNAAGDADKTKALTDKLGVSFKDAAGNVKPMADILPGLSDKFKAMPDGAEKTALATQLFGRSGAQLLPFLNKGSAGIADLTNQAKKMGLVVDDVAGKIFADARKSTRDYAAANQGLQATLGGNLVPVIDSVKNVFRGAMIPVLQATTGFLAEHRGAFLAAAEAIGKFGDAVSTRVVGALSIAGNAFQMFKGAFTGLGSTVDVGALEGPMIALGSTLGGVFGQLRDSFAPLFASLGPLFSQLGPVFAALLPQVLQLASSFSPFGLILGAIAPILPQLVGLIGTLAATLGGALGQALGVIIPVITQVTTLLTGTLSNLIVALLPVIVQLATTLGGVLGTAITTLAPIIAQIAGVLGGVLGDSLKVLMPVIVQLVTTLGERFASTITLLAPIVGQIAGVLGSVLGTVLKQLAPVIVLIANGFGQLLTAVSPLFGALLPLLAPILGLIAPLLQLVGPILTPLIQLFTALLQPILALVVPLVQLLVPVLTFIVQILAGLITGIVNVITWFVNLITGSKQVQGQLSGIFGAIGSFFSDLWRNIGLVFTRGIDSIIGFFTSLPGKILGALSGLGTLLVDAGKNMIQGLLDGAGSLLKNIGSFFLKIVPSWILEPFKAALGIHSPSTVMFGHGVNTMDGYLGGVASKKSALNDQFATLVPEPNIPAPAAFAARSSAAIAPAQGSPLPDTMTLVDTDGSIIARLKTVAGQAVASASRAKETALSTGQQRLAF